ncbi:11649_t:CDS:2 [Dentiscutata heterogama]|uniref:11649_t:CDS:1 n=1 Tax=Dentiscutata heterogama TaxID=1316150 RepID=A0ACA9M0L3_9GLOM|nr:11649_t:CDS:2 [Dentiscutata heterogama]
MNNLYFQTNDNSDLYINDDPDLHFSDDPDFHIIDEVETIYEEDLESFENESVLISSDDELQEIDDNIACDLNEDTITYFTKELASKKIA